MALQEDNLNQNVNRDELVAKKPEGARIICTTADSEKTSRVTQFSQNETANKNKTKELAHLDDNPDAWGAFQSVYKHTRKASFNQSLLMAGYRHRPFSPGDSITIRQSKAQLQLTLRCSLGPIVECERECDSDREFGALCCRHSFPLGETTTVDVFQPAGGVRDAWRVHDIIGTACACSCPDQPNNQKKFDLGFIRLPKLLPTDLVPCTQVTPLLESGFWIPKTKNPDTTRRQIHTLPNDFTEGWLKDNLGIREQINALTPRASRRSVRGVLSEGEILLTYRNIENKVVYQIFGHLGNIRGSKNITEEHLGDKVYMCGQASGLSEGTIFGVEAHVDGLPNSAYSGWFLVKSSMADRPFSRPGDSSSPVYMMPEKGHLFVCGMVVAGVVIQETPKTASMYTLVQPIEPCLEATNTKLVVAE